MYPEQQAAIFADSRYSLIEASTKTGKTFGCIAWLFEQAYLGSKGMNFWWIAPTFVTADIAFRRLKLMLPEGIFTANESKLTIALVNGVVIWFKSGDRPDSLYGEDVYAAVIDEASRMREEAWWAIRSTLTATRGPVRIIGNVKGRRNWFYALTRTAEAETRAHGANSEMSAHKIIAYQAAKAGVLSADEIRSAERDLPAHVFKELYLAQPSDDSGNPFGGDDLIAACRLDQLSSGKPDVWGWDLAKSKDYTSGICLDLNGRQCKMLHFQKPWNETIEIILRETGRSPALVDSTGVGDPVLEALQRDGHSNFEGYKFTAQSKQKLMEGLAVAIQQKQVFYTEPVEKELQIFEYEYTKTGVRYSAPEGFHDDNVCSLALAVQHRNSNQGLSTWRKLAAQLN
jgi:hypothetical protein